MKAKEGELQLTTHARHVTRTRQAIFALARVFFLLDSSPLAESETARNLKPTLLLKRPIDATT